MTIGNIDSKEEEWVGRKENQFSLASWVCSAKGCPVKTWLCAGLNLREEILVDAWVWWQQWVPETRAWLRTLLHSYVPWRSQSDSALMELHAFSQKCDLQWPRLPQTQGRRLDYNRERHGDSMWPTHCLVLWLQLRLGLQSPPSQPHNLLLYVLQE